LRKSARIGAVSRLAGESQAAIQLVLLSQKKTSTAGAITLRALPSTPSEAYVTAREGVRLENENNKAW
jgi:hypothetical protein